MRKVLTVFILILLFAGCSHVISKKNRLLARRDLLFQDVAAFPDGFIGTVVVWGGEIIHAENLKEGTLLEILQKPLDRWGEPGKEDLSKGRFLILKKGYLDTAIYRKGRNITISGEITGSRTKKLNEIEYTYPLVVPKEIYLWREEKNIPLYSPYPYYYWRGYYYPPYWYDPFWYDPYWHGYYPYR